MPFTLAKVKLNRIYLLSQHIDNDEKSNLRKGTKSTESKIDRVKFFARHQF